MPGDLKEKRRQVLERMKSLREPVQGRPDQPAGLLQLKRDEARAALARKTPPVPPKAPGTVQERAKEVFGFEDLAERGTILPLGRTQEGELTLATPQIGVDLATSALLPGHVAQGGEVTQEDVTRFALDFAAPATAGRAVGAALPARAVTRRGLIKRAPTTERLKGLSRTAKNAAVRSGATIDPDRFTDLVAGMETTVRMNKINPALHPKSAAVFDTLSREIGNDLDVEDLHILRRIIGTAQRTVDPDLADDRRIAGLLEDALDDFVDNLSPDDVLAGDPSKVGKNLREFRLLWSRAKKAETIEGIIEAAQSQASGFENGVRIGLRALLKNTKKSRGFSKTEKAMMKEIVEGTTRQKTLRLLGKLSFGTRGGSNFLGGTIGVGLGGAAAGPLGAMASPAIGLAAQKGANRAALGDTNLLRAMTATGEGRPPGLITRNLLADLAARSAGPLAGTQIEQPKTRNRLSFINPGAT